ncbi:unnamed protein product [Scytosiphon promiscuus]
MRGKGDSSRDAQLLRAVLAADFPTVRKLVKSGVSANGNRQVMQDTPLLVASTRGHVAIAEFLIGAGADVETGYLADQHERGQQVASKGMRPLHVARKAEMAALLMREGADPNARDAKGCTPLVLAARSRDPAAVVVLRELLSGGADPRLRARDGAIALFSAINGGNTASIKELLALAPETVNHSAVRDGMTPLCLAAMSGRVEVIELLLSRGATNKTALQRLGMANVACPLFLAVIGRKEEAVRCIVEKGIEAIGGFDLVPSALFAAAAQPGPPNMLRTILTAGGADRQAHWARCRHLGLRVLNYAAGHNCLRAVDVLLRAGASETGIDSHGQDAIDAVGTRVGASDDMAHGQTPCSPPPRVKDPATEAAIRRMLRRGPAYRARSWAWPATLKEGSPARVGGVTVAPAACVRARDKMVHPVSGDEIVPRRVPVRIQRPTGPRVFSRFAFDRYPRKP